MDAHGCDPSSLRSCAALGRLFARIVDELGLHPAGEPVWHVFPAQGGITGVLLLTESHLACHTYPEHGIATFSLCCCRPRPRWEWEEQLRDLLGAEHVTVRCFERGSVIELEPATM